MSEAIENLRILAETTFDDFPESSITQWVEQAIKDYDQAADLIERQAREIEELKKDRDGWKHDRDICNKAYEDCSKQCDELVDENQALAAHVELITHKADNLNSMCAMAVGALPNKSAVAESLVYWIRNWNDFKESQSPQTSLAEVKSKAVEDFAQHCFSKEDAEIYMWDLSDVKDEAKDYANKIRNGGE